MVTVQNRLPVLAAQVHGRYRLPQRISAFTVHPQAIGFTCGLTTRQLAQAAQKKH
jgi:hypothetical protein